MKKAKECINGRIKEDMMGIEKIIKWKDMENLHGMTKELTKANI